MRTTSRQRTRARSLAEFGLVLPILLLVMMGIFDFGRAISPTTPFPTPPAMAPGSAIVDQSVTGGILAAAQEAADQAVGSGRRSSHGCRRGPRGARWHRMSGPLPGLHAARSRSATSTGPSRRSSATSSDHRSRVVDRPDHRVHQAMSSMTPDHPSVEACSASGKPHPSGTDAGPDGALDRGPAGGAALWSMAATPSRSSAGPRTAMTRARRPGRPSSHGRCRASISRRGRPRRYRRRGTPTRSRLWTTPSTRTRREPPRARSAAARSPRMPRASRSRAAAFRHLPCGRRGMNQWASTAAGDGRHRLCQRDRLWSGSSR